MIKVYENSIDDVSFKKIQNIVTDYNFPWYLCNTAYPGSNPHKYSISFAHLVFDGVNAMSGCYDVVQAAISETLRSTGQQLDKLYRIRFGLHTILETRHIDGAHIDSKVPHQVGLIYLNDSDGHTTIYNEKYDYSSDMSFVEYKNSIEPFTVKQIVYPVANTMVCFDGGILSFKF